MEMDMEKKMMRAVASMMRALGNETRLNILYRLYEGPKTWTELIFELSLNPKSLRDHLSYLIENGLVEKTKPVGFGLTDPANEFLESTLPEIISTVKQALKVVKGV